MLFPHCKEFISFGWLLSQIYCCTTLTFSLKRLHWLNTKLITLLKCRAGCPVCVVMFSLSRSVDGAEVTLHGNRPLSNKHKVTVLCIEALQFSLTLPAREQRDRMDGRWDGTRRSAVWVCGPTHSAWLICSPGRNVGAPEWPLSTSWTKCCWC